MEIRAMSIYIALISLIIIGFTVFTGSMINSYGIQSNSATNISFVSKAEQLSSFSSSGQGNLSATQLSSSTIFDVAFSVVAGAFGIAKTFFQVADIFSSMITDLSAVLGVPSWATGIILTIIGLIVFYEIISIALKYRT